jgi:adenosylmethionine-8-amino-7-oxononanoate aminotransferase
VLQKAAHEPDAIEAHQSLAAMLVGVIDCLHHGVLVRPAGENIVICPPYIIEKEHIARIVEVVADSIRKNA